MTGESLGAQDSGTIGPSDKSKTDDKVLTRIVTSLESPCAPERAFVKASKRVVPPAHFLSFLTSMTKMTTVSTWSPTRGMLDLAHSHLDHLAYVWLRNKTNELELQTNDSFLFHALEHQLLCKHWPSHGIESQLFAFRLT